MLALDLEVEQGHVQVQSHVGFDQAHLHFLGQHHKLALALVQHQNEVCERELHLGLDDLLSEGQLLLLRLVDLLDGLQLSGLLLFLAQLESPQSDFLFLLELHSLDGQFLLDREQDALPLGQVLGLGELDHDAPFGAGALDHQLELLPVEGQVGQVLEEDGVDGPVVALDVLVEEHFGARRDHEVQVRRPVDLDLQVVHFDGVAHVALELESALLLVLDHEHFGQLDQLVDDFRVRLQLQTRQLGRDFLPRVRALQLHENVLQQLDAHADAEVPEHRVEHVGALSHVMLGPPQLVEDPLLLREVLVELVVVLVLGDVLSYLGHLGRNGLVQRLVEEVPLGHPELPTVLELHVVQADVVAVVELPLVLRVGRVALGESLGDAVDDGQVARPEDQRGPLVGGGVDGEDDFGRLDLHQNGDGLLLLEEVLVDLARDVRRVADGLFGLVLQLLRDVVRDVLEAEHVRQEVDGLQHEDHLHGPDFHVDSAVSAYLLSRMPLYFSGSSSMTSVKKV